MANNVSIATKPLVYSAFRFINNKVWTALAEYVDNSLQSYLNHKELLSKLNHDGKLNVLINIDFDNDVITIKDDAYGIAEQDYQRAFELANIPLDAEGLNEFGMGMKVSSIWLSDTWIVETSAYGENVRKTMVFDLKEVVDNQETELPIKEEPANIEDHYTIVTLQKLTHNKPTSRQINNVKKHLASIYTKFIREGILNLVVNGETLVYQELPTLNAPYYKNPQGEAVFWRKEICFDAPRPNGKGKYIVKGFIGLLETMSTSIDNGFLLFRRDRVIGTSFDQKYRPEDLCGQVGSPRYKRIYGELYLEGFDVSFTKNSFQEDDDLTAFIELLKDHIAQDKDFDIFGQAQNYVKPKTVQQKTAMGKSLIKQIAKGLSKPIKITKANQTVESTNVNSKENDSSETNNFKSVEQNLFLSKEENEKLSKDPQTYIEPITTQIKFDDGKVIELTIKCEYNNSPYEIYNLEEAEGKYTSVINLKNPFFEQFSEALSKPDGIEQIAYVIKTMVASEVILLENGNSSGSEFRNEFNKLFGNI